MSYESAMAELLLALVSGELVALGVGYDGLESLDREVWKRARWGRKFRDNVYLDYRNWSDVRIRRDQILRVWPDPSKPLARTKRGPKERPLSVKELRQRLRDGIASGRFAQNASAKRIADMLQADGFATDYARLDEQVRSELALIRDAGD
jgi:hypothetical protein